METKVYIRGVEEKDELRALAEERIQKALSRFRAGLHEVTVRLEDVTGPRKQGVDKLCRVEAHLKTGGRVVVEELSDDLKASLNTALDRVKAAVSRQTAKRKRGVGGG